MKLSLSLSLSLSLINTYTQIQIRLVHCGGPIINRAMEPPNYLFYFSTNSANLHDLYFFNII